MTWANKFARGEMAPWRSRQLPPRDGLVAGKPRILDDRAD